MGNLRGIRESGRIFAMPTYFFIVSTPGAHRRRRLARDRWCDVSRCPPPADPVHATIGEPLTLFLLLTAFSNGCTAMTGVEAVSNGVPAFKPPEAKNAAATMVMMAGLAITMFLGITLLAHAVPRRPERTGDRRVADRARRVRRTRHRVLRSCRPRRC